MTPRSYLALVAGKSTLSLLRMFRSGGGALPGLISARLSPSLLSDLSRQCSEGVTLVCGTNGKTTTSRMLAALLGEEAIVHNRSGSNLTRGHLAAFLAATSWSGTVRAKAAILEVDEAVLPATLLNVKPRLIILHNLFRDQLDRYGEVDSIASKWLEALKKDLPPECQLLICADDPNLAWLGTQLNHPHTMYYGLDDPSVATDAATSSVDAYLSPSSHLPLHYSRYYLSHLGEYDDGTGFSRPPLQISAAAITQDAATGSSFTITRGDKNFSTTLPLPGLYNIYNALAASAAGLLLGIPTDHIVTVLSKFQSVFGRFERLTYKDKELVLCLVKNPAGATEVLRTIAQEKRPFSLGLLVNDDFADGQDVSWYWDTPYELISSLPCIVACAGTRSADIRLRMKYAGYVGESVHAISLSDALDRLAASSSSVTYVLSTYTASIELQSLLQKLGIKQYYWKE
ncbi:MAG: MurT ligase domain-containing protein [bacterium]